MQAMQKTPNYSKGSKLLKMLLWMVVVFIWWFGIHLYNVL